MTARSDRWRRAWAALYARNLTRELHDAEVEKMYAWARAHGDMPACLRGLAGSVPFGPPTPAEIAVADRIAEETIRPAP